MFLNLDTTGYKTSDLDFDDRQVTILVPLYVSQGNIWFLYKGLKVDVRTGKKISK